MKTLTDSIGIVAGRLNGLLQQYREDRRCDPANPCVQHTAVEKAEAAVEDLALVFEPADAGEESNRAHLEQCSERVRLRKERDEARARVAEMEGQRDEAREVARHLNSRRRFWHVAALLADVKDEHQDESARRMKESGTWYEGPAMWQRAEWLKTAARGDGKERRDE